MHRARLVRAQVFKSRYFLNNNYLTSTNFRHSSLVKVQRNVPCKCHVWISTWTSYFHRYDGSIRNVRYRTHDIATAEENCRARLKMCVLIYNIWSVSTWKCYSVMTFILSYENSLYSLFRFIQKRNKRSNHYSFFFSRRRDLWCELICLHLVELCSIIAIVQK